MPTTTLARRLVRDALATDIREELRLEPVVFGMGHSRFQHSRSMVEDDAPVEEVREDTKGTRRGMTTEEIADLGRRLRG